jgi:hypothetical protein
MIITLIHKSNTFNGFKDSFHTLHCLLILEEYIVTFEYLSGKKQKNLVAVLDALSRLDMDCLKIKEDTGEALTVLSGSVISNPQ